MEKSKNLIDLYSERILALAVAIPLSERLITPQVTIKKRSPLCGSMVTIDLNIENDKILNYGHEVKACALGQASASILAKDILGKTSSQIIDLRTAVMQMLTGCQFPLTIFTDYQVLSPARDYKNRHASIMLALDATVEGIHKIKNNL